MEADKDDWISWLLDTAEVFEREGENGGKTVTIMAHSAAMIAEGLRETARRIRGEWKWTDVPPEIQEFIQTSHFRAYMRRAFNAPDRL